MTEPTPSIKIYDEATDTWIFTAGGAGGGGGGASTLDELTDVDAASPAAGDALAWDSGSGQWVPTALNLGGASTLNELTDVNATTPADGDALVWDAGSAQWIPVAASAGPEGPAGPPGTAYMSAQWTFNQNVAAPPVSGGMRYNATTIAATTQVFISETDRDGLNRNAGLDLMTVGDQLMVQSAQGRAVFNIASVTDSGTYRTLGVTVAEFTGTRPSASAITTVYSMTSGSGGGATTLNDLTDVTTAGAANGHVLTYSVGGGTYTWIGLPVAVTESGHYGADSASGAWDNSLSTYWSTGGTQPAWTAADFGSPKSVSRIRARSGGQGFAGWTLDGSPDGIAWTTILTPINAPAGSDNVYNFSAVNYRHYRLIGSVTWTDPVEFTLYGTIAEWVSAAPSSGDSDQNILANQVFG